MQLPSPQQFAQLLRISIIPDEAKEIILEKLPTLSKKQILAIYAKLEEEQERIKKAKTEYESKINFAKLKFDQKLIKINTEQ